jgi:hypothetical protein
VEFGRPRSLLIDSALDVTAHDATTNVMTSNGSSLGASPQWSSGAFYGTSATVVA